MQNSLKKGLISVILGFVSLSALNSYNSYSEEQNQGYSRTSENYQENRNGFRSIDLVFAGLTTLGAYYVIKRLRRKQ